MSLSWVALCFPAPHHNPYDWRFLPVMESLWPKCPPEQGLTQIFMLLVKNFQTIRVGKSSQLIQTGPLRHIHLWFLIYNIGWPVPKLPLYDLKKPNGLHEDFPKKSEHPRGLQAKTTGGGTLESIPTVFSQKLMANNTRLQVTKRWTHLYRHRLENAGKNYFSLAPDY